MSRVEDDRMGKPTTRTGSSRPPHLQWQLLGIVALGGMLGTAARAVLNLAAPHVGLLSVTTFAINVSGAFVLGLLLEWLSRRGRDIGRRRALRLFAGTGILGGYTTYSALATETAQLVYAQDWPWAIAYAFGTVIAGAAASTAGVLLAAWLGRRIEDAG